VQKLKLVTKGNDTVHAKHNGERLFMDISIIRTTSYGGSKFWLLVVDNKSDYSAVCGILGSGEQTRIESCIIRIPESMV
jgi:hypothetical protein